MSSSLSPQLLNPFDEIKLSDLVKHMKRLEETTDKKNVIEAINKRETLTEKCILTRCYLSHKSTDFERIIKNDLKIGNALNSTSGDGYKNGLNYEIKTSVHANKSKINFVQIRPDHNVDYYILVAYNMYENHGNALGKAHIFKIHFPIVYELVIRFGGYAHGTVEVLGKITVDNIIGRNCEYALRCDPNATKGKSFELWNELKKYEVEYDPDNF